MAQENETIPVRLTYQFRPNYTYFFSGYKVLYFFVLYFLSWGGGLYWWVCELDRNYSHWEKEPQLRKCYQMSYRHVCVSLNLLCSCRWPWNNDTTAFTFRVLKLQAYNNTLGFCMTNDGSQGFVLARKTLHQPSYRPNPVYTVVLQ